MQDPPSQRRDYHALEKAWEHANEPKGDPSVMLTEAKSRLGWYYVVCTDHADAWFKKEDLKDFASVVGIPDENQYGDRRPCQREHLQGAGRQIREMAEHSIRGRGQEEFAPAHMAEV